MINPQLLPFLAAWEKAWAPLPATATPQQRHRYFLGIAATMRLPNPDGVEATEYQVPFEKRTVRVVAYRHRDAPANADCLVYMHGGGWMQGSPETHCDITSRIAADNKQLVISVDYALAPEHVFPTALHECRAVVLWAKSQSAALRIDPNRLAIGGDSAGGNLAAALAIALRGTTTQVTAQLLIYPAVDFTGHYPSLDENIDGPIIKGGARTMSNVRNLYCPNEAEFTNPLVAPLHAKDHRNLPPAYIAVAEHDPLRDEGRAYAKVLIDAGVPVVLDQGKSLFHGYLRSMGYGDSARTRLRQMSAWLRSQ